MEPVSRIVKEHVPNYLSNLPVPNSIGGWFRLGVKDWLSMIPLFAVVGGASYATYRLFRPKSPVNPDIKKTDAKVVDSFNIEDLGDKAAFCRCWRSSKFPYCDGAHGKYNKTHGDNVGPLIINKKK
ncbi:CDGSH iron-sulfur domain-containing protein 2 homolog [Macrosteles quadrilineatus]|uniref:CDGSH iron-sulfur domain-containing protein 2 homolog n=1 Tax=Macrosteles quadrilineatus TaxID=74068 RepID=UPI0023E1EEB1|nr:CDGSH iron-sulfur domain-containing protein 2 homolog [Macrosteles quadrilineatus]